MDTLIVVAFILWIVASAFQLVHNIPPRWKGTLSIILALAGIGATYLWADTEIKQKIDNLVKSYEKLTAKQDSLAKATQNSLSLLRSDHTIAMAMHDSVLIRIARVDSCIDRHFRQVNRRISNIEK